MLWRRLSNSRQFLSLESMKRRYRPQILPLRAQACSGAWSGQARAAWASTVGAQHLRGRPYQVGAVWCGPAGNWMSLSRTSSVVRPCPAAHHPSCIGGRWFPLVIDGRCGDHWNVAGVRRLVLPSGSRCRCVILRAILHHVIERVRTVPASASHGMHGARGTHPLDPYRRSVGA